jgi:hypothetical protein
MQTSIFLLFLLTATANVANAISTEDRIKFCLSALYTAEKAYHHEHNAFAATIEEIGFNKEGCDISHFSFEDVGENYFYVSISDKSGKKVGAVDSNKEITLF